MVIRGPLGVGKTTVARAVARRLRARYVSIDRILDAHRLVRWRRGRIALESFLRANTIALRVHGSRSPPGRPLVLDGNFYYAGQLRDLLRRAPAPPLIFDLRAPLATCLARDAARRRSYGEEATAAVYRMSARFAFGEPIDATQPLALNIASIVARVRRSRGPEEGGRGPVGPPASGEKVRLS